MERRYKIENSDNSEITTATKFISAYNSMRREGRQRGGVYYIISYDAESNKLLNTWRFHFLDGERVDLSILKWARRLRQMAGLPATL